MKRILVLGVAVCSAVWTTVGLAYEPGTHALISDQAANSSVLVIPLPNTNTTLLDDLGLSIYKDNNQTFIDIQSSEGVDAGPDGTDPFKGSDQNPTVQGLIKVGAELEDEKWRPLNHFFDPISGKALNLPVPGLKSAPAWAQNSTCTGASASTPYNPSGFDSSAWNQCYSLQDARNYFRAALTAPNQLDRQQQFGNLFLTLGHVMHLLQDMAQPQHVRNEMHCDDTACHFLPAPADFNPSEYEKYAYTYTNLSNFSNYPSAQSPVVNLSTQQDYWFTAQPGDSGKQGLAEFTNSNFLSPETNFTILLGLPIAGKPYTSPYPNDNWYNPEKIEDVFNELGPPEPSNIATYCTGIQAQKDCIVNFIATDVNDNVSPDPNCSVLPNPNGTTPATNPDTACVNAHASSYSIFSADLKQYNVQGIQAFALNSRNYLSAVKYLLPRAIGYSAGLINYFFRGRLAVQPAGPGAYTVTNISTYKINGPLEVYYDAVDGNRYMASGSPGTVNLDAANCTGTCNSSTGPISISIPSDKPAPAKPGVYMFVINGTIGTEPGIAAKQVTPDYIYTTTESCGNTVQPCGSIWQFTSDGSPSSFARMRSYSDALMVSANNLAVFGQNYYTVNGDFIPGSGGYLGCFETKAEVNGTVFADFPNNCRDPSTDIQGVAVNTNNVYLFAVGASASHVYVYDHQGKRTDDIPVTMGGVNGFAANDNFMCWSGYTGGSSKGITLLTDLKGNVKLTIPGDPILGGGSCALTKDRLYILATDGNTGFATVNVYDINSVSPKLIASLNLSAIGMTASLLPQALTATDKQLFVSSGCTGGSTCSYQLATFNRVLTQNPDGSTSETFTPASVVPMHSSWNPNGFAGPFWDYYMTMDMQKLLAPSTGQ